MEKVTLKPISHRGQECIGIYFNYTDKLNSAVRKISGIRWSKTNNCWYVPLTLESYEAIRSVFNGLATTDDTALKIYLNEKKKDTIRLTKSIAQKSIKKLAIIPGKQPLSKPIPDNFGADIKNGAKVNPVNEQVLTSLKQQLILKAYSAATIHTYTNEMTQFLQAIKSKPAKELTAARIKDYLQYCFETLKLSEATLHSRMNALKFYYEQVLNKEKFFWEIPRPKKQTQLPKVFSQDEIAGIINSVQNKKHKVMLMLAYSAGLRVSEVVSVRTYDIDSNRMTIFIRQAKGKKDRLVTLSPILLVMLREYAIEYKPAKKGYLFEGLTPGTPYATRSLQEVIQFAKKKAGVIRPGSIHSLRHSFASHLIERGTDVTMIQKLLGHNDIKTTLRYLHTSNKDLLKIISPLDDLKLY